MRLREVYGGAARRRSLTVAGVSAVGGALTGVLVGTVALAGTTAPQQPHPLSPSGAAPKPAHHRKATPTPYLSTFVSRTPSRSPSPSASATPSRSTSPSPRPRATSAAPQPSQTTSPPATGPSSPPPSSDPPATSSPGSAPQSPSSG